MEVTSNSVEFTSFIYLVVSGILFFCALEKSLMAKRQLLRVLYVLASTACSVVFIEAVMRLIFCEIGPFSIVMSPGLTVIVLVTTRIIQVGLCLVGILMAGILYFLKKEKKPAK